MATSSAINGLFREQKLGWWQKLSYTLEKLVESRTIFELAASMTLVLVLLYAGRFWYLQIPLTILVTAAMMYRSLLRSDTFWFVITVVVAASNFHNWYYIDNHKYLITYWCLALYFSRLTTAPDRSLRISARLLIGLAFFFATIWKLISDDFINGTFFHYSLLMDDRFAGVATLFGGLSNEMFAKNHMAIRELLNYNSILQVIQFQDTIYVPLVAKIITWWTIIIEGLIAITFLWPDRKFISKWRDLFLLTFLLTTYLVAPVVGFGWVLIIMGMVQATSKMSRLLYVLAFFILQIYLVPWETIFSYFWQL